METLLQDGKEEGNEDEFSAFGMVDMEDRTTDSDDAAVHELFGNRILVETNKGLVCMSLNNEGAAMGEDFQNVAETLLSFQETPFKMVANENDHLLPNTDYDVMPHVKPTQTVPQRRTLLKSKIVSPRDFETAGPSRSLVNRKPLLLESDDLDYVLVSDSGLSSDTSEIVSASNASSDSAPPKKRGGWPKGRKRKPDNKAEIRPPKAPATGYVLFLNEKRKDYKNLRFTEVTKLLGNEWSRLSTHEKRKYLEQAEVEKKRYREELKAYRQTDTYRQYLQRKKSKRVLADGTEESDMDATDEIDEEEDSEELYCRPCNQWFHSLHNKKEHMYGRQHLAGLAGSSLARDEWPLSTSLDESSLDGIKEDGSLAKDRSTPLPNVNEAVLRLTSAVYQREAEIQCLSASHSENSARRNSLMKTHEMLKKKMEVSQKNKQREIKNTTAIEQTILKLERFTNACRLAPGSDY